MSIQLGPKLAKWLGCADTVASWEETAGAILERWPNLPQGADDDGLAIVDELVHMDRGQTVLAMHALSSDRNLWSQFRGKLLLGSAAMLAQEIEKAMDFFAQAQAMNPHELAPYRNIVQICISMDDQQACRQWCEAGFDIEPNDHFLWEHYAWSFPEDQIANGLKEAAKKWKSWCGASLAAHMTDPQDALLRSQALAEFYARGLREAEFLIEYTAALGAGTQYEEIPPIVFEAETRAESQLPWQLYAHTAQAYLGMEKANEAKIWLIKAKTHPELPEELRSQLDSMFEEIEPTPQ